MRRIPARPYQAAIRSASSVIIRRHCLLQARVDAPQPTHTANYCSQRLGFRRLPRLAPRRLALEVEVHVAVSLGAYRSCLAAWHREKDRR